MKNTHIKCPACRGYGVSDTSFPYVACVACKGSGREVVGEVAGTTLNDAQDRALSTAIYPGQGTLSGLTYAILGLNGEAGELAEHLKKMLRDDAGVLTEERRAALKKELGDQFWYVCAVARELGFSLQEVADKNAEKLAARAQAGTLHGSGSDR